MDRTIDGVALHYVEHGDGMPLLVLHGAGVDHREPEGALEALGPEAGLDEVRRIYLDLPAMGRSTADGIASNDDVVRVLAGFIESWDSGPVLLVGHSYGAYLAQGVAARHPALVAGLALICPVGDGSANVPEASVVASSPDAYSELEPSQREGFDDYVVVRTAETARRYRERTVPGIDLVDRDALGRIFASWALTGPTAPAYPGPVLIVAGRQDATAGFEGPVASADSYPDAQAVVIEDAGHALMHERPEELAAELGTWLARVPRR